jgi:hypothetical protein
MDLVEMHLNAMLSAFTEANKVSLCSLLLH